MGGATGHDAGPRLASIEARLAALQREREQALASIWGGEPRRTIEIGRARIGAEPVLIAGPCSVESAAQMELVAGFLRGIGGRLLRGGAFKPRTSPYAFQGLGREGLEILRDVADRYELVVVTEILDPRDLDDVVELADVLQVGTRNMANAELLSELGAAGKPVLLKRGFMSTAEEFLLAARHVELAGNPDVILCERGVRGFEKWTRNRLDVESIPWLRRLCPLPLIADVSHAAGRKDLIVPLSRASLAAGADGVMVEVHPDPARALSDNEQQLDLEEAADFYREVFGG